jgi:hypothetical protein
MTGEELVRAAEANRYAAMIAGNVSELAMLLDEDLIYTHSDGSTDDRESYLAKVTSGHFVYQRIDAPIERLVVFGDTAIIAGKMLGEVVAAGQTRTLQNACLTVYRRNAEKWRLIAFQPTPFVKK